MTNRDERRRRAQARVDRVLAREDAAQADYGSQPAHRIPLGQPILLGHHSQRRHERDLERLHRADDRLRQAANAVADAEHRAAHSGYAIAVNDDDAAAALRDKLDAAEAEHAAYVAHNTEVRRTGSCNTDNCPGCAQAARRHSGPATARHRVTLSGYVLTNSRGRIRQIREQLVKAEAHAAAVAAGTEDEELAAGPGWALIHDPTAARVRFIFDNRPDPEIRALLKRHGFRWAPSAGAWQRQDTGNGLAVARHLAQQLADLE